MGGQRSTHNDDQWQSPQVRALVAARDVGGVIRFARQLRGWKQSDLGQAAGYSASTISRLETGRRAGLDLQVLRDVADAAGVPRSVLGALIAPAVTVVATQAKEDDSMRRRTLLSAAGLAIPAHLLSQLDDALAVLPTPSSPPVSAQIAARLARARANFDSGDLTQLVTELPDMLALAHEAAETQTTPAAYAQAAACYDVATEALSKIGRYEASRITADRASTFAGLSGSPISMATSARALSIVLRHDGRAKIADRLTLQATHRLETTGLDTSARVAAYAQMLCTCAYTAAQAGDRDRALDMIRQAARIANRLPPQTPGTPGQPFTSAHVSLYEIGVHWSLGDAGAALRAGRDVHPSQLRTPERRGRLYTDLARAWWQWGKPEQTVSALLNACRESLGEVRARPAIRAMAVDLITQHPRVSGVQTLAVAIGYRR
ncbi:helix-turn-helix transcriptional regulator [Streptosporangium sp. NPDC002544]|uniref:helix-turn-helix domain-containing protein n=1 Tax=Streptosporangium sp. NPDC002544 TaxID=3154538 RepID=UPI00331EE800